MSDKNLEVKLKIVATLGERTFEGDLAIENGIRINGFRIINKYDISQALKRYILRNCGDEEILFAIATEEYDKRDLAYNPNIPSELANRLADELCYVDDGGMYPYAFCVILQNPKLSGNKLDLYAHRFLEQYNNEVESEDNKINYELIYLLRYIAKNPAVWEDTLEYLKHSGIPMVVAAAER
ncbi:MAG: hypothetical protein IKF17_04150 [Clostridia bacterium]|nr:hypothetical protein [Clostridia bacterium]